MPKFLRMLFGIPLAGIGIAAIVATVTDVLNYYGNDASFTAFFGAICLLGAFFLLRRA